MRFAKHVARMGRSSHISLEGKLERRRPLRGSKPIKKDNIKMGLKKEDQGVTRLK
jgi:hypothetical protein